MAVSSWLFEKRPLKRAKLGPPDVYPQDPKQKEDELTAINVKQGFNSSPQIPDEYGSARNSNITATKFGSYFSAVLGLKQELNRFQDSGRKRQQINPKDNFWLATSRSKNAIEAWFKDLAGSKSLTILAKKVPIFNKKEDIFMTLYEHSVPMLRAAWFIKMLSAYYAAISEAKIKKRQLPDPSQEWTQTLCKFLREQLHKLSEHHGISATSNHGSSSASSLTTNSGSSLSSLTTSGSAGSSSPSLANSSLTGVTAEVAYKQWQYCTQLARHLYEEGLLDRQDFLTWILDLVEKTKDKDDPLNKPVLALVMQYIDEFKHSQLLSRRLAHHCAKRINYLLCEHISDAPRCQSPVTHSSNNMPVPVANSQSNFNPISTSVMEYLNCCLHRSNLLFLSAILQIITLECQSALVWNNIGESKTSSVLHGSPLDFLPCAPSSLPMPQRPFNSQIRVELRIAEEQIRQRGRAAEVRWSCDKWQQTALGGSTIQQVLNALDALDRHNFDRVDSGNSLDTLYAKVFPVPANKDKSQNFSNWNEILVQDEAIVRLLCEWAVTTKRCGEHRAIVVAKLLEKRQADLSSEKFGETDVTDEKDSQDSTSIMHLGVPVFQNLLVNFLDTQAPVIDDRPTNDSKTAFANLVLLFAELICNDVFSHDAYMCTLISRGSFANVSGSQVGSSIGCIPHSNKSMSTPEPSLMGFMPDPSRGMSPGPGSAGCMGIGGMGSLGIPSIGDGRPESLPMFEPPDNRPGSVKHEPSWDTEMDTDEARIDADLGKLLQHIKEGQQNMSDQPDSVGSDKDESTPLNATTPLGHPPLVPVCTPGTPGASNANTAPATVLSNTARHLLYTTHIPLPLSESPLHDCNQRHILLYGVGKAREDAKHIIKKMVKELLKLFSKKAAMDIADGAKIKKSVRDSFNFEGTVSKFQSLSYFDQHHVTNTVAAHVIEMLSMFSTGSLNYLPLVEYISYLFELMELALNIHGLIEFCIQLLKELPDVEAQLVIKSSSLAGSYVNSIGLSIVGILYTCHCCLLVSQEQTVAVFDGLSKIVKHINTPNDCNSSAERCILAYLNDINSYCNYVKPRHPEQLLNLHAKVKNVPYPVVGQWNQKTMIEYLTDPRLKIDVTVLKQFSEQQFRYSFVCTAIHTITVCKDPDKLNEISVLCAELTAKCPLLIHDWIGALKAICMTSSRSCGFMELLAQINLCDITIHDNLAVLTSILVARRCFLLQDFVCLIALPAIIAACPSGGGHPEAGPGARLTCHLLRRLCKKAYSPPGIIHSSISSNPQRKQRMYYIKYPCDRHLLSATHSGMQVEAILAVLKAIMVLGDSVNVGDGKIKENQGKELNINDLLLPMEVGFDISLPPPLGGPQAQTGTASGSAAGIKAPGLSEYAKEVLKQIRCQDWIHEKCLRYPEVLCSEEVILDAMLTHQQSQQLLRMICRPHETDVPPNIFDPAEQKALITSILTNLDLWTLRVSWLELQFMYKQCEAQNPPQTSTWLDSVAKATIDVFQMMSEENQVPIKGESLKNCSPSKFEIDKPSRVWLVAPLIGKLPAAVQGKMLRAAGQVLESGSWSSSSGSSSKNKDRDKQAQKNSSLLSHQPFLSLVLMCLKGQDEQREGLLNSLHSQLSQSLYFTKDDRHGLEEIKARQAMQEALQLRLSLVGGMFDMIQRSTNFTTDWAVLLVQLICYGVVDPQTNFELFTTVLDMLAVLIHTTQISDTSSPERGEENKKQYLNLVKKLKKEVPEKNSKALKMVKQLLPLTKHQCEVITCEAMGSLIDTKGNKIAGFDSIDKKQGLQVSQKQKVSPWDLLEGHKNPAPLSWSWFWAVRMERKPLRHEESHRLLLWHTHSLKKPSSYYLEPPPLPAEDLEPPPEKQPQNLIEDMKRGRDTPLEQSPRGNAKKPKQQQRRRRAAKMPNGQVEKEFPKGKKQPAHGIRPGMGFPDQMMYQQAPPQSWYGQQPPMQQPPYYSPQQPLPPAGGPRFERPLSQSKQALSTMLRARHPSTQFLPGPGGNAQHPAGGVGASGGPGGSMPPGSMGGSHMAGAGGPMPGRPVNHPGGNPSGGFPMEMMQKHQQMMIRQQMRPQNMPSGPGGPMYPHGMQGSNAQTAPLHHLPQQGMSQGYGNYSNSSMQPNAGMMESRNSSMLPSSFNQSYSNPQSGPGMMPPNTIRNQQGQYMPQSNRSQYGMGAPNVTVNPMSGGSHLPAGSQMVQGGSGGSYGGQSNPQSMPPGMSAGPPNQMQQHMQQLCHQQQLMAMQKQQQHQQQHPQQQPQHPQQQQQTAALVAHLRHMNAGNQGPPHPQQQHHSYHPQGPY